MAAAAILNSIYRSELSCYCTYFHKISYACSLVMPSNRAKMKFNMATATILYFYSKHNKSAAD